MQIEPTSETWEAIERDGLALVSYIARKRGFAKIHRTLLRLSTHLCYYESRMSAPIFTGSLWAVLPGRIAITENPGDRCAVCESCKALVCKVLG